MFQGSLKGVSRKFHECFKDDSGKFQGCFERVIMVFQGGVKGVSRKF